VKNLTLPIIFFAVAFIVLLLLSWFMFGPILHPMIFGAIMAGVFAPLNDKIIAKTKWGSDLASSVTCLIIFLFVILPGVYILIQISSETYGLYQYLKEGFSKDTVRDFLFGGGKAAVLLSKVTTTFNVELTMQQIEQKALEVLTMLSGNLLEFINKFFGNILAFFFNFGIMLLTTFALLAKGPALKEYVLSLSPLPDDQEELIIDKFNQMNYVTMVCNGLGGVIQGFLAAIGLWIAGIESIFLWFVMMILLAFIPLVGISVITIPASIYLMVSGKVMTGTILLIYCTAVALIVENWFKPKFIGKRIQMDSILVFFYILAGMSYFGMAGIFYGPLICIVFMTMVELYHQHYKPSL
jgi:predicted PurR-regulated permease PerM